MSDNSAWKQQMLNRVRGEFLEMPGLRVRIEQAQRLWKGTVFRKERVIKAGETEPVLVG